MILLGFVLLTRCEEGDEITCFLFTHQGIHRGHGGEWFTLAGDLGFLDHLGDFAKGNHGVAIGIIREKVSADFPAVLELDRAKAITGCDLCSGVDQGSKKIGGIVRFTNRSQFGADLSSYSVHGVAALTLRGAMFVEELAA